MRDSFDRTLARVRLRCDLNLLLAAAGTVALAAGAAAALALLAERTLAVRVVRPWTVRAACVAAAVGVAALWRFRRPSCWQVALLIDRRAGLHERFSSALALAERTDGFSMAAAAESRATAGRADLARRFPIRPPRRWLAALAAWAASGALALWMPQVDLLGHLAAQAERRQRDQQLEQARQELQSAAEKVRVSVEKLGDSKLSGELAKLAEAADRSGPDDVRRQAVRRLGDLAEEMKRMRASPDNAGTEATREMLKKLRAGREGPAGELDRALARSDFREAAEQARKLREQVREANLSDEARQALAEQLEKLTRQLEGLADEARCRREALADAGLDEALAELDDEQLPEALKDQGLTDEQVRQLLEKMDAQRRACEALGRLTKSTGRCGRCAGAGELTEAELAELIERLHELEAAEGRLTLLEEGLDDIEDAVALLGAGQGGLTLPVDMQDDPRTGSGMGTGRASGKRPSDDGGETGLQASGVKNRPGEGQVIASWYFQGGQVKGEARRELTEVIQAAKDGAAEALNENRIPRKYEESVKKYFGQLEGPEE